MLPFMLCCRSSTICMPSMTCSSICFKGGDVTVASNYRPVSLLPIISRMLEKFVQQRLMSFLTANMLLPDSQFAYRKNHSTEDAITLAMNRWLLAKHERQTTGIVFVDMSKAFDRVRHDLLVSDLAVIGVRDIVLSWFCDYLSDRLQRVRIGDDYSDYAVAREGYPKEAYWDPCCSFSTFETCLSVFHQQSQTLSMRTT